jgi:hypothetical protein
VIPTTPRLDYRKEIIDLTYAISTINAWNRIAISLRAIPGHYQPPQKSSAAT